MKRALTKTFCLWINDPKTKHYFLEGLQTWLLFPLLASGLNAFLLGATWIIVDQSSDRVSGRKSLIDNLPEGTASSDSSSREATAQQETEKAISTGVWAPVNRR